MRRPRQYATVSAKMTKKKAQAEAIGKALQVAAIEMELTPTDLGSKMGVTQSQVRRYYDGLSDARAIAVVRFMHESATFAKLLGFQRIADAERTL